ncbi:MAG: hypothetical protein KJ725_04960 [Gammaproteobacteria bacterium]|uniref:hypothetical protein n=1 Tax=Methylotuvimicrobium sp. TaxID=2822413 RepID=UPI001D5FFAE8|nr:hypothetical protein [Gammaproteobacteria bacterium]
MTMQPQFITDTNGNKISVILSLEDYEELLEDLEDLAAVAERKDEEAIPFEEAVKEIEHELRA